MKPIIAWMNHCGDAETVKWTVHFIRRHFSISSWIFLFVRRMILWYSSVFLVNNSRWILYKSGRKLPCFTISRGDFSLFENSYGGAIRTKVLVQARDSRMDIFEFHIQMYLGYKGKKASNNFDNAILFLVFILLHFFSLKTLYQLCEDEEQTLIIIQTSNGEVRTKQSYTVISVLIFSPVFFYSIFYCSFVPCSQRKTTKTKVIFPSSNAKGLF